MPSQCHGQKMPFDIPRGMIIGLSIYVGILTMVVYKSRFLWMLVGWSFPLKKSRCPTSEYETLAIQNMMNIYIYINRDTVQYTYSM